MGRKSRVSRNGHEHDGKEKERIPCAIRPFPQKCKTSDFFGRGWPWALLARNARKIMKPKGHWNSKKSWKKHAAIK